MKFEYYRLDDNLDSQYSISGRHFKTYENAQRVAIEHIHSNGIARLCQTIMHRGMVIQERPKEDTIKIQSDGAVYIEAQIESRNVKSSKVIETKMYDGKEYTHETIVEETTPWVVKIVRKQFHDVPETRRYTIYIEKVVVETEDE